MTVYILYVLHPKMARRESVCNQNPMNNNRVLCTFRPHLGYGGVNICNSSDASVCGNHAFSSPYFKVGGVR
jgi:hypothetical protein